MKPYIICNNDIKNFWRAMVILPQGAEDVCDDCLATFPDGGAIRNVSSCHQLPYKPGSYVGVQIWTTYKKTDKERENCIRSNGERESERTDRTGKMLGYNVNKRNSRESKIYHIYIFFFLGGGGLFLCFALSFHIYTYIYIFKHT
jgi:hypothetical protein